MVNCRLSFRQFNHSSPWRVSSVSRYWSLPLHHGRLSPWRQWLQRRSSGAWRRCQRSRRRSSCCGGARRPPPGPLASPWCPGCPRLSLLLLYFRFIHNRIESNLWPRHCRKTCPQAAASACGTWGRTLIRRWNRKWMSWFKFLPTIKFTNSPVNNVNFHRHDRSWLVTETPEILKRGII